MLSITVLVKSTWMESSSMKPLGVDAHIEGGPADVESAQTLCDASLRAFETWTLQGIPGIAPNQRAGGERSIDG